MSFDLVLIRRFEAICRLRSLSRAADELGLSHSAMTKSLRTLEESLGVELVERTTRTLAPTAAGERLLMRAGDLLAHAGEVRAAVLARTDHLNVLCGPVILDALGAHALSGFSRAYPGVHVALHGVPGTVGADQLVQRRADLLLVHRNVADQLAGRRGLAVTQIISEPYHVLFRQGHPVLQSDFSLEALLGWDWVLAGFDALFQEALPPASRELLLRRGFPKYRISSLGACAEMVEADDLLTLVPACVAAALCAGRGLASIPLPGAARFSVCGAARTDEIGSVHIAGFMECVRRAHMQGAPSGKRAGDG